MPLLGNLRDLLPDKRFEFLNRAVMECGEIGVFTVGPQQITIINSGTIAYSMMTNPAVFHQGALNHAVAESTGPYSLIALDGDIHKELRKVAAPAFAPRQISEYAAQMVERAEDHQARWEEGALLSVADTMRDMVASMLSKAMLNLDRVDEGGLWEAMGEGLDYVDYLMTHPIRVPTSWPTPRNLRARKALTLGRRLVQERIERYRRERVSSGDMLSTMVLAVVDKQDVKKELLDNWLIDTVFNIFGGGIDTTPTTLTWAWKLLCEHPDVYARARSEVDTALQGRQPKQADLGSLPYVMQVLKEVQRIYPAAYMVGRVAKQDAEIEGYFFPKGRESAINIYGIHRDPRFYPNPERFDPDRFSPENEQKLPKGAHMPFGAGPHFCIGSHFAMLAAPLVLATLIQRVTFELVPGPPVTAQAGFLLRPTPFQVKVRRRTQLASAAPEPPASRSAVV